MPDDTPLPLVKVGEARTVEEFIRFAGCKPCRVCRVRAAFRDVCPLCEEKAHWDQVERDCRREGVLILLAGAVAMIAGGVALVYALTRMQ